MVKQKTEAAFSKPKKEHKLDLFKVLGAVDTKQNQFYNDLSDEEKKSVPFVPILRMLSSVSDQSPYAEYHILMVNEILNQGFWDYLKYPDLLWRLMCIVGSGRKQYHSYIKFEKQSKTPILDKLLLAKYEHLSEQELQLLKSRFTNEELEGLAKNLGYQDNEIKELQSELKKK